MDVEVGPGLAQRHFGAARLGDARRAKRLVNAADHILRQPLGSLPEKLENWAELIGLYRLVSADEVTHAAVLEPHRQQVLARMRERPGGGGGGGGGGVVLLIHDATELNYTHVEALRDQLGQVGSGAGRGRGYIAHHTLAVTPRREVLGLVNQVLHRRRSVDKGETRAAKRGHPDRESRLWVAGCEACGTRPPPPGCTWVDVTDRGGDTFEFLSYAHANGRRYVIRSAKDRRLCGEDHVGDDRLHDHLHAYARDLPTLGTRVVEVPARAGRRAARRATVAVAAGPVTLAAPPPYRARGEHDGRVIDTWVIRVSEVDPPPPAADVGGPLEWILLSNRPAATFAQASESVDFYACRPLIEDYHKGLKTGLGIERLQFAHADRLEPAIALLSVVAALLLGLRHAARAPDAGVTPAAAVVPPLWVRVLSAKLHGRPRDDLSVREFVVGVARLGGFLARKHDGLPGWQTLWRGWHDLHLMIQGALLTRGGP
jgi:hypothetical protein